MLVLAMLLLVANRAYALEHVVAKVTLVEATYVPAAVAFILSKGTVSCPAGKFLFWERSAENNKAVYAMLMAALIGGNKIQVVFNDGDTGCVPQYLHLVE
ncbi:hypothetical protein CSC75_05795 [Pseudoxanthomonas wuyuanensis]|nr:hypothetical protein CSC75_05795 [Pseudoxanthomonas wuyuanensis]